jgi:hypothetical protein
LESGIEKSAVNFFLVPGLSGEPQTVLLCHKLLQERDATEPVLKVQMIEPPYTF